MERFWKGDCDLRSVVGEVYDISARLPGSKVGEILVYVGLGSCWRPMGYQDGKAAAGSVKNCGVGQGCTLLGWGFMRLVGWQYRKINEANRILLKVIEIYYRRYFSS